jgi:hypothetical protein
VLNFYDPDGVPVLDKFCMMLEDGGFGKWDMIKKSLLMQSGAGGVIKDGLSRHKKTKAKKEKSDKKQGSLFGDFV